MHMQSLRHCTQPPLWRNVLWNWWMNTNTCFLKLLSHCLLSLNILRMFPSSFVIWHWDKFLVPHLIISNNFMEVFLTKLSWKFSWHLHYRWRIIRTNFVGLCYQLWSHDWQRSSHCYWHVARKGCSRIARKMSSFGHVRQVVKSQIVYICDVLLFATGL